MGAPHTCSDNKDGRRGPRDLWSTRKDALWLPCQLCRPVSHRHLDSADTHKNGHARSLYALTDIRKKPVMLEKLLSFVACHAIRLTRGADLSLLRQTATSRCLACRSLRQSRVDCSQEQRSQGFVAPQSFLALLLIRLFKVTQAAR
jgi:hypothetical protein